MVLLNIIYGLIIAIATLAGLNIMGYGMAWYEFMGLWAIWSVAHILYDFAAYGLLKLFNKNQVVRMSDLTRLRQ